MGETAYKVDFGLGAYKDEGCPDGEHPSCLQCPLIMCKYERMELEEKREKYQQETVRNAVVGMLRAGYTHAEIRSKVGVSERSVRHIKETYA